MKRVKIDYSNLTKKEKVFFWLRQALYILILAFVGLAIICINFIGVSSSKDDSITVYAEETSYNSVNSTQATLSNNSNSISLTSLQDNSYNGTTLDSVPYMTDFSYFDSLDDYNEHIYCTEYFSSGYTDMPPFGYNTSYYDYSEYHMRFGYDDSANDFNLVVKDETSYPLTEDSVICYSVYIGSAIRNGYSFYGFNEYCYANEDISLFPEGGTGLMFSFGLMYDVQCFFTSPSDYADVYNFDKYYYDDWDIGYSNYTNGYTYYTYDSANETLYLYCSVQAVTIEGEVLYDCLTEGTTEIDYCNLYFAPVFINTLNKGNIYNDMYLDSALYETEFLYFNSSDDYNEHVNRTDYSNTEDYELYKSVYCDSGYYRYGTQQKYGGGYYGYYNNRENDSVVSNLVIEDKTTYPLTENSYIHLSVDISSSIRDGFSFYGLDEFYWGDEDSGFTQGCEQFCLLVDDVYYLFSSSSLDPTLFSDEYKFNDWYLESWTLYYSNYSNKYMYYEYNEGVLDFYISTQAVCTCDDYDGTLYDLITETGVAQVGLYFNPCFVSTSEEFSYAYDLGYDQGYYDAYWAYYYERYYEGYDKGYSAGYSAGVSDSAAGYDSGYSDGYTAGESAGYDSGYSAGYQAAYDEFYYSRYNAGYTTGYDKGYDNGYSVGYNEGYQTAYDEYYDSRYDEGYSDAYNFYFGYQYLGDDGSEVSYDNTSAELCGTFTFYNLSGSVLLDDGTQYDYFNLTYDHYLLSNNFDLFVFYKPKINFANFDFSLLNRLQTSSTSGTDPIYFNFSFYSTFSGDMSIDFCSDSINNDIFNVDYLTDQENINDKYNYFYVTDSGYFVVCYGCVYSDWDDCDYSFSDWCLHYEGGSSITWSNWSFDSSASVGSACVVGYPWMDSSFDSYSADYIYNLGYDAGYSSSWSNPVSSLLSGVGTLLEVKIFGVFSLGSLVSIGIFLFLALAFIKLFAG